MRVRGIAAALFAVVPLFAQSGGVVGSGSSQPAPVSVAPGQIVTFFVDGVPPVGPLRAKGGTPLPTELAGITATVRQGSDKPAPIVEVRPVSTCPDLVNIPEQNLCGTLTAVTVQIPYELRPFCPLCLTLFQSPAQLIVSANGKSAASIELNPLADQVHILKSCDVSLQQFGSPQPLNTTGLPCPPMVTHADGTLVSASSPAQIGEALTAWAFGLGQTDPPANTGQVAATAARALEQFYLDFNYSVNALPTKPFTGRPDVKPPKPDYAGLAPGTVGLYQINFTVPDQPTGGTPRCPLPGTGAPGADVVQSNLTVSIGGQFSFDGAGICVGTRIPVD
ncbi:MAG TPA: hypothetical protein VFW83_06620 [Bryobacteraceae bacterium]|nr:hypothetical protein [Bryobacteraceae bacterium]